MFSERFVLAAVLALVASAAFSLNRVDVDLKDPESNDVFVASSKSDKKSTNPFAGGGFKSEGIVTPGKQGGGKPTTSTDAEKTKSPETRAGEAPESAEKTDTDYDEEETADAACEDDETTECLDRGAGERAREDRDEHADSSETKRKAAQDAAQSGLDRTIGNMEEARKLVDELAPDAGIDSNFDTNDSIPIPMPEN